MVAIINFKQGRQDYSLYSQLSATWVFNILIISNKHFLNIYFVSDTVLALER